MTWPTPLEIAAVIFILANVWLATKENIWSWPAGIVSVILYGVVFYQSCWYANVGLQVVFLVLSIHGWYEWLHGGEHHSELHVRRTTVRQWIGCSITGILLSYALYLLLRWANGSAPISDAVTSGFSIVGQWMLNEKLLENWWIWLSVDLVYVPMFIVGKRLPSAGLYAFFCVLCIKGIVDWKRSMRSTASA